MIPNDTRKILKAVDDLNRHGIYPSKAEIVRRAFGKVSAETRFNIYDLIEYMASATGDLAYQSSQNFRITPRGRGLINYETMSV